MGVANDSTWETMVTWFSLQGVVARWRERGGRGTSGDWESGRYSLFYRQLWQVKVSHWLSLEQNSGLLMPSVLLFDSLSGGGKGVIGQILNSISIMIGKLELCDYMDLPWCSLIYFCHYLCVCASWLFIHFSSVQFCEHLWIEPVPVGYCFFGTLELVVLRTKIKISVLSCVKILISPDCSGEFSFNY